MISVLHFVVLPYESNTCPHSIVSFSMLIVLIYCILYLYTDNQQYKMVMIMNSHIIAKSQTSWTKDLITYIQLYTMNFTCEKNPSVYNAMFSLKAFHLFIDVVVIFDLGHNYSGCLDVIAREGSICFTESKRERERTLHEDL